jgi:hypothetical protein
MASRYLDPEQNNQPIGQRPVGFCSAVFIGRHIASFTHRSWIRIDALAYSSIMNMVQMNGVH